MKILIVGGAGYIGGHVTHHLVKDKSNKITILDNLSTGYKSNVPEGVKLVQGDILDEKILDKTLKEGFDCVLHFAALKAVGESMQHPERYSDVNIKGTLNLLNAMIKNDVNHIVFSSSAAIFGQPQKLPLDENHPKNPDSYYGFTKLEIEHFLEWYSKLKGIHFAALRYFNAAGYNKGIALEKNPANLLPIVLEVASGRRQSMQVFGDNYDTKDGSCIRDYIHVEDLATAHEKAMKYIVKNDRDLKLNLGTGKGSSVLEVIKLAEKITGKKINFQIVPARAGDPAISYASAKLAQKILGWKAEKNMKDIIKSMWEVYRNG